MSGNGAPMMPTLSIPAGPSGSNHSGSSNKPEEIEMTVSPVQSIATPAQSTATPAQSVPSASSQQMVPPVAVMPGGSGQIEAVPPVVQPTQEFWDEKICLEVEYNPDLSLPESAMTQETAAATTATTMTPVAAGDKTPPPPPPEDAKSGLRRSPSSVSTVVEPAPAYKTYSEVEVSQMAATYRGEAGLAEEDIPRPMDKQHLFGYPRKTVMWVAGGIALVLVLVLSVSLGVTLGRAGKRSGSGSSGDSNLMDNGRIAATNWTESNGVTHTGVSYQHSDNSLMLATRDSVSNVWRTINVTESVIKSAGVAGLDVLPSTSLAMTSNNAQHTIYYLNSRRQMQEIFSTSINADSWAVGMMSGRIKAQVAPGSRIAATRQLCLNCTQSLFVTWQDSITGNIRLANFTGGEWNDTGIVTESSTFGTSLAISTFTDFRGTGPYGPETNALRLYLSSGPNLVEQLNGPLNGFVWAQGNFDKPLTSGLSISPAPEIASITYGNNGWVNNLVSYLSPKGLLQSAIWRGDTWSVQPASIDNFDGGKSDGQAAVFTALAATQTMTLYAVSDGRIHEMRSSSANPFLWTWEGIVTT